MKKLLILMLLACVPFKGISQSIFDKFENSDRIGVVTISKGMLNIFVNMMENDSDPESREFVQMAKNIDGIKIFLSEDNGAAADMAVTMEQYVKSSRLEELMKVKDGDTSLKFYIKQGKDDDHVEELLMFATGIDEAKDNPEYHFETVLLTMTGNIDLTKVGALTNKMKLHNGLNKIQEK